MKKFKTFGDYIYKYTQAKILSIKWFFTSKEITLYHLRVLQIIVGLQAIVIVISLIVALRQ